MIFDRDLKNRDQFFIAMLTNLNEHLLINVKKVLCYKAMLAPLLRLIQAKSKKIAILFKHFGNSPQEVAAETHTDLLTNNYFLALL